jgi:hypothetical protein
MRARFCFLQRLLERPTRRVDLLGRDGLAVEVDTGTASAIRARAMLRARAHVCATSARTCRASSQRHALVAPLGGLNARGGRWLRDVCKTVKRRVSIRPSAGTNFRAASAEAKSRYGRNPSVRIASTGASGEGPSPPRDRPRAHPEAQRRHLEDAERAGRRRITLGPRAQDGPRVQNPLPVAHDELKRPVRVD